MLVVTVVVDVDVAIEEVWVDLVGDAEVVDVVEMVVVALVVVQLMPSDNSRASLPFNPQPTTRSRSARVSDMSYTGALVNGRDMPGRRSTQEKRGTPCALHGCTQSSVSRCDLTTARSDSAP